MKAFRRENVLIPRRVRQGPRRGEISSIPLTNTRSLQILHNPRYAGAFFFGSTRQRRHPDGSVIFVRLPRNEWAAPLGPPNLRSRALRVAQCVEYGGPLQRGYWRETLVPCQRCPNGTACPGLLAVLKQSDDAILAFCLICKSDEYLIYEWEDTLWAKGPMEPVSVAAMAGGDDITPRQPGPEPRDEQLARALILIGSSRTPAEIRRMIATARAPSEVIQAVVASCPAAPSLSSLERCIPVLMNLWNDVQAGAPPRPQPPRKTKIGANERCPCGSGKKHKRCCMLGDTFH